MYAVVAIQGHQYIVKKDDEIVVDVLDTEEGKKVTFDTVLLGFQEDGSSVVVGQPYIAGASVTAKVVSHQKGDKLRVLKFQGKKRYQRVKGFRAKTTTLSIDSIKVNG